MFIFRKSAPNHPKSNTMPILLTAERASRISWPLEVLTAFMFSNVGVVGCKMATQGLDVRVMVCKWSRQVDMSTDMLLCYAMLC